MASDVRRISIGRLSLTLAYIYVSRSDWWTQVLVGFYPHDHALCVALVEGKFKVDAY